MAAQTMNVSQLYFDLGNKYIEEKKFKEAIKAYTSAIVHDSSNAELYNLRAAVHALLKDYKSSFVDAQKVIELNPKWGQGYFRSALSLLLLGETGEALDWIDKGLEVDPTHKQLNNLFNDLQDKFKNQQQEPQQIVPASKLLPVTVLSGFLGAGKTSMNFVVFIILALLNHVLHNKQGLKVAVIVNDISEVNIDAQLIEQNTGLNRVEEKLVELNNGCICCTLRQDLLEQVAALAKENKFDYLLIESTGISEPLPVAQTYAKDILIFNSFSFKDELGVSLSSVAKLDTLVTVVDAYNFMKDFSSGHTLQERKLAVSEEDSRDLTNLLIDQIEFANVIILNKLDLVTPDAAQQLESIIRKLNPDVQLLKSTFSKVDPKLILNTGLFDMEKSSQSPGWIKELMNKHTPETEEYGISSFVYRSRRPFHPERLWKTIDGGALSHVIRSKGIFWLAPDSQHFYQWATAGSVFRFGRRGTWVASLPDTHENKKELVALSSWQEPYGDRRQEVVVMGVQMDKAYICSLLDACLMNDEEMKMSQSDWSQLPNPFEDSLQTVK